MAHARVALAELIKDMDTLRAKAAGLLADIDGTAESVTISRQGRWARHELELLWSRVEHLHGVRALFEITAGRPGREVTFTDLLAHSGLSEQQQRNEHARMSRVSAELFGAKRWPIENWQGAHDETRGKAEMIYRMPEVIARWWQSIR